MDVKQFLDDLMTQLDGAFAENTLKAYRSDFKHFANWAISNGLDPLPPKASDLAAYIADMSECQKSATIRRRLDIGSLQSWVDDVNPAELHIEESTPVWEVTAFN